MSDKINLFVYGTLLDETIFQLITGGDYPRKKALLRGFRKYGRLSSFPHILPSNSSLVEGAVVFNLNEEVLKKIDHYEDEGNLYLRQEVEVECENEILKVETYVGNPKELSDETLQEMLLEERLEEVLESKIEDFLTIELGVKDEQLASLEKRAKKAILGYAIESLIWTHFKNPDMPDFTLKYSLSHSQIPHLNWIKDTPEVLPYVDNYLALIIKAIIFNEIEERIRHQFRGTVRVDKQYYEHTISTLATLAFLAPRVGTIRDISQGLGILNYNPHFEYIDYVVGAIFIADELYKSEEVTDFMDTINFNRQRGAVPIGAELEFSNVGHRCIKACPGLDKVYDSFYYFHDFDLLHRLWKLGGHRDDHCAEDGTRTRSHGFLECAFGRYCTAGDLSKPSTSDPWILNQLINWAVKFLEIDPHSLHLSFECEPEREFNPISNPSHLICLLILGGDVNFDEQGILREKRIFNLEIYSQYTGLIFSRLNHHKRYSDDPHPQPVVEFQFPRLFLEHNYEALIMALKGFQLATNPIPFTVAEDSPYYDYHREIAEIMIEWAHAPYAITGGDIASFMETVSRGLAYENRTLKGHNVRYLNDITEKIEDNLVRYNNYLKRRGKAKLEEESG